MHASASRVRWALVVRRSLVAVSALAFVVIALAPFGYVLSDAFKPAKDLFQYPPEWLPSSLYLGNFEHLLHQYPFVRWTLNTLIVAGVVTAAKIVIDSMAGYALAKLDFGGKGVVLGLLVATVMIPPAVLLLPLFFIVRDLHGIDTYWALILPPLANPVGILMMRGFIAGVPGDLAAAARLDGCSELGIFRRIVLPLVKPGLVVVGMYTFLVQYTSFAWPLVITTQDRMRVLTTGLATLKTEHQPDWGLISAAALLAVIPITLVFIAIQRRFVQASLAGAIKG